MSFDFIRGRRVQQRGVFEQDAQRTPTLLRREKSTDRVAKKKRLMRDTWSLHASLEFFTWGLQHTKKVPPDMTDAWLALVHKAALSR